MALHESTMVKRKEKVSNSQQEIYDGTNICFGFYVMYFLWSYPFFQASLAFLRTRLRRQLAEKNKCPCPL
jgi:hypothetical protein